MRTPIRPNLQTARGSSCSAVIGMGLLLGGSRAQCSLMTGDDEDDDAEDDDGADP